jgi:hypothetical protein
MGKAALIVIAAFTLMGAYYTLSSQRGAIASTERLAGHQIEVLARNAALSGYQQIRQNIADAGGFEVQGAQGQHRGANFEAYVTATSSERAVITSRGWMGDSSGRTYEYNIRAEVQRDIFLIDADEVPLFMRFAMATNEDLNVSGNVLIDTLKVEGNEDNIINANIHTNGNLSTRGNSALIRGFGTYVTSHDVGHARVFQPYYNPTNEPVLQRVAPVDIPRGFNARQMAEAMGYTPLSTLPVTMDVRGGDNSADNPTVFFVDGDAVVPSGFKIEGHAIFLVQGSIDMQGGVSIGSTGGRSSTTVGFYASHDINVGGNSTSIWGTLVAGNNVKFHGTPTIYGGVGIGGAATIDGTPNIRFVPPSPALAKPFTDPEINLTLLSYNEW